MPQICAGAAASCVCGSYLQFYTDVVSILRPIPAAVLLTWSLLVPGLTRKSQIRNARASRVPILLKRRVSYW
ncbi:uncharacterized protein LAJ45_03659 [Morchella importuna]|uniref:uncharacterized protein n=1 Tax=Morchella importuna TaxID=1174673 RepID=UPI001E8D6241|nr:uncharacterized protein LAJ45_03659 [Morchella importuna]KAH8152233.1 hypothetical protein LAJ45_03659 [Morchella importuna]